MPNPAEDMVTHINGLIPSLVPTTNLFASKVRAARDDVPVNAVFVWAGPGAQAQRTMGHTNEIRRPVVMVHIRNGRQKDGSDIAQQIFNTLMGTVPTGYLDMFASTSAPVDNGYDSDGRHNFAIAFVVAYEET